MDTNDIFIGGIIVVSLIVIYVGFCVGFHQSEQKLHKEAISNSVAYWSVNATNGETTFTWKK